MPSLVINGMKNGTMTMMIAVGFMKHPRMSSTMLTISRMAQGSREMEKKNVVIISGMR